MKIIDGESYEDFKNRNYAEFPNEMNYLKEGLKNMYKDNIDQEFDEQIRGLIIKYGQNTRLGTDKLCRTIVSFFKSREERMLKELAEGIEGMKKDVMKEAREGIINAQSTAGYNIALKEVLALITKELK